MKLLYNHDNGYKAGLKSFCKMFDHVKVASSNPL